MLEETINKAVAILKQGGLVGMPTETVYGLAADATNLDALRKIFTAKQRPIDHPLIVHLADISQLSDWTLPVSPMAMDLVHAFWPGPMTLILPKAGCVSDLVTGGQATIGIRIPRHPVAQALLKQFGGGLAAPSANRFGRISPTTAEAVREELGSAVDLVLEGGQCEVGVESTIIDVSQDHPVILRPGMISVKDIERVLHRSITPQNSKTPRVSGSLASHYAPVTPMQLIKKEDIQTLSCMDVPCVLVTRETVQIQNRDIDIVMMPNHPKEYAHALYQTLRALDKKGFKRIYIETVPEDSAWSAIRDRLMRASNGER